MSRCRSDHECGRVVAPSLEHWLRDRLLDGSESTDLQAHPTSLAGPIVNGATAGHSKSEFELFEISRREPKLIRQTAHHLKVKGETHFSERVSGERSL